MNQPLQPVPAQFDDEIDLFELFENLWGQRFLIAGLTSLATLVGVVAALVMPPTYQAEARLLPPLVQDVHEFNVNVSGIDFSPEPVYEQFKTNLNSVSVRRAFFEVSVSAGLEPTPDLTPFQRFNRLFNGKLDVSVPTGRNADTNQVTVLLEGADPEPISQWVNAFVGFAAEVTTQDIINQIDYVVSNEIRKLSDEIASRQQLAATRRNDRIVELEEALVVSRAMGLTAPMIESAANRLNMEYMRGVRSIEAEIEVLKNRVSDDPFISGIRDRQERIAFLESIRVNSDAVRVVRVDQAA